MKSCLKKNKWLLAVTVLFSALTSAATVFVAIFLQKIIDVTLNKDMPGFWRMLIVIAVYLAVYGFLYFTYSVLSKKLVRNLTRLLRGKVFHGILKRSDADFSGVNTADYLSAMTNDVKLVEENYISPLLLTLQHAVTFVVTLVLLLRLSPLVTLCLVVCMVLMYTVPSLFGKLIQKKQDALSGRFSIFTAKLKDIFSGYEVIKAFHITGKMEEEFRRENETVADIKYDADRMFVINESLSQMLAILTQVASIFLSAYLVLKGNITMGTLVALVQLGSSFVWPIVTIMQSMPKIKSIRPVLDRLDEFSEYEDTTFTGTAIPQFEQDVTIHNLSFAYQEGSPVLRNAALRLEKNKKYAVVGGSGCGKTTLMRLLTGCYAGYEGEIQFDGAELRTLDIDKLKQMISMIHQNIYMFDKDIEENIGLYGDFKQEEWNRALYLSGVEQFLPKMANGLYSPVGENGANLSGGQRQRIAIARALIQKTPILILDEGTSAIDMQTAYDIESSLLRIDGLTLLTITHKMSSELLSKYDCILFMEKGCVAEQGSLEELLEKKGAFYEFYSLKES